MPMNGGNWRFSFRIVGLPKYCVASTGSPSKVRDANALVDTSGVRLHPYGDSGDAAMRLAAQSALKSAYAFWMAWLRSVYCSSHLLGAMHVAPLALLPAVRSGSFQTACPAGVRAAQRAA